MGIWKSFACLKCGYRFESILDICSKCGSKAAPQSGIADCLLTGRPPGIAGGSTTRYSARSYDRLFARNFEIMGISNLYHKDGVPVVTRAKNPRLAYNTMPAWAGPQAQIKAYCGAEAMRRDGVSLPPLMVDGKPFALPNEHPVVEPGSVIGRGLSESMRSRTVITHRTR